MTLPRISDWNSVARPAKVHRKPIVVMVDRDDCPYCRRVEGEFFAAILAQRASRERALFGKIPLDEGESIRDENGIVVDTREFLAGYAAGFTPTVLFLEHSGKQVASKLVGLSTPDFYGYYLERGIEAAIKAVRSG